MRKSILIIFLALVCAACQADRSFISTETVIPSRGLEVPATFVHPVVQDGNKVPLVVMAHGHGGTREEAGAFARVAEELGKNGIASVRVDFSGCGDSTEPFTENVLSNMLADIRASREFAVAHPAIDSGRVGILGYSMGGRLAMLATEEDDYSAVVLWTPVASKGVESMIEFLGGQQPYEALKAEAEHGGFAVFRTPWGDEQHLSLRWFTDLEDSDPLAAIRYYEGALLVLYGDEDRAVDPRFSKQAVSNAERSNPLVEYVVEGGGHGLGFYDDNAAMADEVVVTTTRFLKENL